MAAGKIKFIIMLVTVILSAAILLLGCGSSVNQSTDNDIVLPDIVFVKYSYYPGEREYKTGKFTGTSGYYIDKNGYIKYFEFEDQEDRPFIGNYNGEFVEIDVEEYSTLRKLSEFTEKIRQYSFDTQFDPIPKEDLVNYYKLLLKINSKENLKFESSNLCLVFGSDCFYGVRTNENNEEEYIVIYEGGDMYYINENKYANDLYKELANVLY